MTTHSSILAWRIPWTEEPDGKEREKKRTKKNKHGRKNYQENTGRKLITNTKKQKLKIQSRVWNFKNTMLKKRKKKTKEKTNKNKQCRKNYKETTGTKLISNIKKHKLKTQSTVWNFKNTMLKKRRKKNKTKKQGQKIIIYIYINIYI